MGIPVIRGCDEIGLEGLLLLLAPFFLFPGETGGRGPRGPVPPLPLCFAVGEDGPDSFFARGEVGGDVEECGRQGWHIPAQLSDQVSAGGAREESLDNLRVADAGQLGALFGEVADEVSERLVRLLATTLEVLGVPGAHVCAQEIPDEDLYQVAPVVDLQGREVFEPGSRRV